MEKHYLFRSRYPLRKGVFEDALSSIGVKADEVVYQSDSSGEIVLDATAFPDVEALLRPLTEDLGFSVSFLVAHQNTVFEQKLLKEALDYYPNRALFPTDIILKEMGFGDYSSFPSIASLFKEVPHDLMETAATYLRCGMDACLSAKQLIIHRNTFNYRLAHFIEMTNLDIRDYHNALLLELYFQLSTKFSR